MLMIGMNFGSLLKILVVLGKVLNISSLRFALIVLKGKVSRPIVNSS